MQYDRRTFAQRFTKTTKQKEFSFEFFFSAIALARSLMLVLLLMSHTLLNFFVLSYLKSNQLCACLICINYQESFNHS